MKDLINFIEFSRKLLSVKRDIFIPEEKRNENSMEHSYQVALISWYIAQTSKREFSVRKVLEYSLVHDLVEIEAGDTPLYSSNIEYLKSKKEREEEALESLRSKFKKFTSIPKIIERYEELIDEEAKLVYAADKLLPIINIYLDGGYSWRTHNIKLEDIILKNKMRINVSPEVKLYFKEILEILEKNPELFYDERIQKRSNC